MRKTSLSEKGYFFFVETICSKYILAESNIVDSLFPILMTVHKNICLLLKE